VSISPEIRHIPVLKGSGTWKAAASESVMASLGGTGGATGCGGLEEDHPATWETHDLPPAVAGRGPANQLQRAWRWDACQAGTEQASTWR